MVLKDYPEKYGRRVSAARRGVNDACGGSVSGQSLKPHPSTRPFLKPAEVTRLAIRKRHVMQSITLARFLQGMKNANASLFFLACLGAVACAQTETTNLRIPYPNPLKHVVLIIQENRTPDTLFHTLLNYPGINAANYDLASSGLANVNGQDEVVPLTSHTLGTDYDLGHSHGDFEIMWNNGKMDGANSILDNCSPHATDCSNQGIGEFLSYQYVQASDIDPYLQLAAQYGWANSMFQTNQGASYVAHQILFSGTSAQTAEDDANAIFVSGIPFAPKGSDYNGMSDTGCLAPLGEGNSLISPQSAPQMYSFFNDPLGTFCFQHDSMATLLDAAQFSWKYYSRDAQNNPYPNDSGRKGYNQQGYMFTAPSSLFDICQPDYSQDPPVCTSPEFTNNIDVNPADVLTDIADCNLASVSWVTPTGQNSDHPGTDNFGGPSWVASIVNAIGTDSTCEQGAGYWSDTAILVVWDDWGGWYDHVAPTILPGPPGDYELGFRVPFLVISAYTPKAYVSNIQHEFGSILRFVEGVFDVPEGSLQFSDARTTSDLGDFFAFGMKPRAFQQIAAPLDREYFLHQQLDFDPPDTY